MSTITNLCAINRYEHPQWLIEPKQDPWDEEPDDGDAEVIANLNDPESGVSYRVLDENIRGWGQHTHIIRTTGEYGEYDYLATME